MIDVPTVIVSIGGLDFLRALPWNYRSVLFRFVVVVGFDGAAMWLGKPSVIHVVAATLAVIVTHAYLRAIPALQMS